MLNYDEIREFLKDVTLEEKIRLFRQEARPILSSLKGYSELITLLVKERGVPNMPDNFLAWCETIVEKSVFLQDWIEAAFYPDHRSIYQEQDAKREREFGKYLWKHQQAGLPELRIYQSLQDAINDTAQNLELSLKDPSLKIDDHFWYPGGGVNFLVKDRKARVDAKSQQYGNGYMGYSIALSWTTDQRNRKGRKYESLAPDLKQLTIILYRWLIQKSEIIDLIQETEWLQKGTHSDD